MEEKSKYTAQAKFIKEKTRRFVLNANVNTDGDIIEHLEQCKNVQGYLKALIRNDIKKNPAK